MNRRRLALNLALGGVVFLLMIAGAIALVAPSASPTAKLATVTVQRGVLQATVTASGNIKGGASVSLSGPATAGKVKRVFVELGQEVKRGDRLVGFDDSDARAELESAQTALASARAGLQTATQARSRAERESDAASIAAAEQTLANAKQASRAAKDSLSLVRRQQTQLVESAKSQVQQASAAETAARTKVSELNREVSATNPDMPARLSALKSELATAKSQLTKASAALAEAESARDQTRRTSDTALLQAEQAVSTQSGVKKAAERALKQTKANVAVAQQSPRPGAVNSAKAQVASAELQVEQARAAIAEMTLLAPFDGVVAELAAVVGQSAAGLTGSSVSAGGSSGGLVTVVAPEGIHLEAAIAEADAVSVRAGQAVTVYLPASEIEISGEVLSVDVQAEVSNNVVQYATRVTLVDPPDSVKIGQTASLSIVTGSRDDVTYLSTSAIVTEAGSKYVDLLEGDTTRRVQITTGLVGAADTEVISGLEPGDRVVLPQATVSTGAANPADAESDRSR